MSSLSKILSVAAYLLVLVGCTPSNSNNHSKRVSKLDLNLRSYDECLAQQKKLLFSNLNCEKLKSLNSGSPGEQAESPAAPRNKAVAAIREPTPAKEPRLIVDLRKEGPLGQEQKIENRKAAIGKSGNAPSSKNTLNTSVREKLTLASLKTKQRYNKCLKDERTLLGVNLNCQKLLDQKVKIPGKKKSENKARKVFSSNETRARYEKCVKDQKSMSMIFLDCDSIE